MKLSELLAVLNEIAGDNCDHEVILGNSEGLADIHAVAELILLGDGKREIPSIVLCCALAAEAMAKIKANPEQQGRLISLLSRSDVVSPYGIQ